MANMPYDKTYEIIKQLCKERNTNITQLCKAAAVPRSALSDYVHGRKKSISLDYLIRFANYFEVPVDYLLGNETNLIKNDDIYNKKNISDAEASEILRRKFVEHGIIKEGEDISDDQLEDYLKKLSAILKAMQD